MGFQIEKGKLNELRSWDRKKIIFKYSLFKNVLRQLLFLEIVSVRKIKNKLLICMVCVWRGGGGRSN